MQKAALLLSALNHYHLQTDQLLELHHLTQVLVRQLPQQTLLGQKGTEAKARAEEVERELASLSIRLHASLVRAGLHRTK